VKNYVKYWVTVRDWFYQTPGGGSGSGTLVACADEFEELEDAFAEQFAPIASQIGTDAVFTFNIQYSEPRWIMLSEWNILQLVIGAQGFELDRQFEPEKYQGLLSLESPAGVWNSRDPRWNTFGA
jgi:hypothetical protein